MIAKFEFKLPEDQGEFELMQKSGAYHSCLYQIACLLRAKTKHSDEIATDWTTVRALIWEIIDDYEIDPYT